MDNYSFNPLTQELCEIPTVIDDASGIGDFISFNQGKPIVVVQGLGFVGAVMSLVCANAIKGDYAVIGVDLADEANYWKIKSINDGQFPLVAEDPKIAQFFESAKTKGNFYATYDSSAYSYADVIIVDINLDVQKSSSEHNALESFTVNLTSFKRAIGIIRSRECNLVYIGMTNDTLTCGACSG